MCGLQDVSLGHNLAFDVPVGEFVQVLHTGRGHWVTILTIGYDNGEVNVFNSMAPALTGSLQNQTAALLCTRQMAIRVRYMYVTFRCMCMCACVCMYMYVQVCMLHVCICMNVRIGN